MNSSDGRKGPEAAGAGLVGFSVQLPWQGDYDLAGQTLTVIKQGGTWHVVLNETDGVVMAVVAELLRQATLLPLGRAK